MSARERMPCVSASAFLPTRPVTIAPSSRLADEVGALLADLRPGRGDIGDRNVGRLQRDGQVGFGRSDGKLIGLGIDPEQQLPLPDRAVVLDADFEHVAGDLRGDLRQEGLDPGLRGVRRVAVGQHVIDEQDQQQRRARSG